jgi:hypothetical protein
MGSARLTGCSPPKSLAIANAGVVILRRLKSSSYDLAPILNGPIFLGAGPFFPMSANTCIIGKAAEHGERSCTRSIV